MKTIKALMKVPLLKDQNGAMRHHKMGVQVWMDSTGIAFFTWSSRCVDAVEREQCSTTKSYTTILSTCCLQPPQKRLSKMSMHLRDPGFKKYSR